MRGRMGNTMENMEGGEDKQEEMRLGYSVDSLLEMDWRKQLSPLVRFLNLEPGSADLEQAVRESNLPIGTEASLEALVSLANEMAFALDGFYSMRTHEDAQRLEDFLTPKLAFGVNRVKIIDLKAKKIRVDLVYSGIIRNIWADFICIFLYRDNWRELLGRCPQCRKWFERSRKDQIYDVESCRGKAAYARNQEARRAERRERYRKTQNC